MLLHVGAGNRGVGITDRSFLFFLWRLRGLVRLADIGSVRGRLEYVGTGERLTVAPLWKWLVLPREKMNPSEILWDACCHRG